MCFVIVSVLCFALLIVRRKCIGSELGGPFMPKLMSAIFLFFLWTSYIVIASLQAFGVMEAPCFRPAEDCPGYVAPDVGALLRR